MEEDAIISTTQYPPGIRFHPSDEELISYYLERKVKSLPLPPNVITDIELYNYNPWDLPRKTLFGEDEWYFFTPRDRKYPKGGRPNRTAASGYWKATGTDKPIFSSCGSRIIGVRKGLVFYKGKPLSGHKMDWIMTEYRLPSASQPSRSKGSMRLDDWVLCRVRMRQKGNMSKNEQMEDEQSTLPPICIQQDSRNVLADYVQSSEHQTIVSLLVGHDPRLLNIPKTISQSQKSGNSSRAIHENRTEKMSTHEADFYLFSDSVVPTETITNEPKYVAYQSGQLVGTKSYYQHVMEGHKCKPNYQSNSNAYINYFQELDMPPLEQDFLQ